MRHNFKRSVFKDSKIYEIAIRNMLFGYAKNQTELSASLPNGPAAGVYDTNAIVYGLTVDSAKVRASEIFRGSSYLNVLCVGSDTDFDDLRQHLHSHRFNGHFIICPEVAHARDHVIAHLAVCISVVTSDIGYRNGRYDREFHTLVPTEDVESDLLWAMFEQWKCYKTSQRPIYIENETRRFDFYHDKTHNNFEAHIERQKKLSKDVTPAHVAGSVKHSMCIAPPHDLDPVKTFVAQQSRTHRFDTKNLHPVRVGLDFNTFSPLVISDIISDLSPRHPSLDDEPNKTRTICVPDRVMWHMFAGIVNSDSYYPPERRQGCSVESGDRIDEASIKTVYMEEISK